jgi:hypothetical protein
MTGSSETAERPAEASAERPASMPLTSTGQISQKLCLLLDVAKKI